MSCQALAHIIFYWLLLICVPIGIWTTIVLNKFNSVLKDHGLKKSDLKNKGIQLSAEVVKQIRLFKISFYSSLASAVVLIILGFVVKSNC